MKKKGLTFTYIFEANSANYGEGLGNVTSLKKFTRGDNQMYTYISRQAIRYNLINQLGFDTTNLNAEGSVIQFHPDATIEENPEIDFFGYMKTGKGNKSKTKTRPAAVRLSHAISMEPFHSDLEFLTNKGLFDRYEKQGGDLNGGNISQSELHKSYYAVTFTIDLDKIGIDEVDGVSISPELKSERVIDLLKGVKFLHRDIRGRRENLSPLFIVGGVYDYKNAFFENRLKLDKNKLNTRLIEDSMNIDTHVQKNTTVGYMSGVFDNEEEIFSTLQPLSIAKFFETLEQKVKKYYGV